MKEDKYQQVINVYYTALMTFLVFTFAKRLLNDILDEPFCTQNMLFVTMWLSMIVQTTFAYVHIRSIKNENYSKWALVSDCIDVLAELYVCVAIMYTYDGKICDYRHLSIPFVIIEINQFIWYILVREFNPSAIVRICILLSGMLWVTISEWICPSIVNLYHIVALMVLITILRAIGNVNDAVTKIWHAVKHMYKHKK